LGSAAAAISSSVEKMIAYINFTGILNLKNLNHNNCAFYILTFPVQKPRWTGLDAFLNPKV